MPFELTTTYPSWYILLCFLTGLAYAAILYYRSRDVDYEQGRRWLRWPLAFIRFFVVFVICLLLLSPLLKSVQTYEEKPKLVVAVDNSESVKLGTDSSSRISIEASLKKLRSRLSDKFDLVYYTFGDQLTANGDLDYTSKSTDLANSIEQTRKSWKGQNLKGMILVSDGIANKGLSAEYISQRTDFPIYTVTEGDTTVRRDLRIEAIRSNSIAYLGNRFPLVVDIAGKKVNGESVNVSVYHNGEKVASEIVGIDEANFFKSIEFQLTADHTGTQQYEVRLSQLDGEVSVSNNRKMAYVDVIDSRQKIVLLASAPHPDLGAIRRTLSAIDNYELIVRTGEYDLPADIPRKEVSLVILHQMPDGRGDVRPLLDRLKPDIPILVIIGKGTNIHSLNQLDLGLGILDNNGSFSTVTPLVDEGFTLFELDPETRSAIVEWPPLEAPFGQVRSSEMNVLLRQQIGLVETKQPLLGFLQRENVRYGYLLGEGFWKWSLQDYRMNSNFDASTELLRKTIQYLSVKVDKRRFRVIPKERTYYENDIVEFQAELYNESYSPVNDPDVSLVLTNENGDQFDYIFSRTSNSYKLDAGLLRAGEYQYKATTQLGGKQFVESGSFVVRELKTEGLTLEADRDLMIRIAGNSGGKHYDPDQLDQLSEALLSNPEIKPVIYSQNSFREILNLKWIFFLLVGLLSLEWATRKWAGGY